MIKEASSKKGVRKGEASSWYGISRQSHYQALRRKKEKEAEDGVIVALVKKMRQRHPRMGCRKILSEIRPEMEKLGVYRGRDAFFKVLGGHDLLVPKKHNQRRTTRAGLWRCANLVAEAKMSRPHQAWVGDITYLETEGDFVYLALLTDLYSRFIVGYDVSSSLAVEGSLRTLNQAIAQTPSPMTGLIHHTDHGVQYTARIYYERLQACGIRSSMGEVGNCYDNPYAERVNGILKLEYGLDSLFVNLQEAQAATEEAVWLYNYERPHLSLGYRKPAEVHFS